MWPTLGAGRHSVNGAADTTLDVVPILRQRRLLAAIVAASVALTLAACATAPEPSPTPITSDAADTPRLSPSPSPSPTFDASQHSIDDPASIWVVVNKLRPLNPVDYEPKLASANVAHVYAPLMRPDAAAALARMFHAGAADGAGGMQLQNSYRSYATQVAVHGQLVAQYGMAKADAQSARPGFSEHQTGYSLDIATVPNQCSIQECFGATPQGVWLAANAYRFGFILRYPQGKQAVTGYIYEPWHFRYVGVQLATEMHDTGVVTLEEFFGLPPAPDYAR
jgi:zinc D-Ala-D-Ala carboxypeptidase